MREERHITMVVNGHVYGVALRKGPSFFQEGSPEVWFFQVAEYGIDNVISMGGVHVKFDPDTPFEYPDAKSAVAGAYHAILWHQAEQA